MTRGKRRGTFSPSVQWLPRRWIGRSAIFALSRTPMARGRSGVACSSSLRSFSSCRDLILRRLRIILPRIVGRGERAGLGVGELAEGFQRGSGRPSSRFTALRSAFSFGASARSFSTFSHARSASVEEFLITRREFFASLRLEPAETLRRRRSPARQRIAASDSFPNTRTSRRAPNSARPWIAASLPPTAPGMPGLSPYCRPPVPAIAARRRRAASGLTEQRFEVWEPRFVLQPDRIHSRLQRKHAGHAPTARIRRCLAIFHGPFAAVLQNAVHDDV